MQTYPPGTRIGQYEIASRPMMGGMGVVYFALDHGNDGRPVALKTFRPELLPDRAARDRFLREGTAWVELGNHPHIVRCYKVEYIDPVAFLVLELIAKEQEMPDASLRSWLIPGHPLPIEQALLFALQIVRGMQYATERIPGFVHRDLKPENILVGVDRLPGTNINRLRVTDFGLVKTITDSGMPATASNAEELKPNQIQFTRGVGTPLYMAPEQWNTEPVGVFTDIYAFGCILFEMLNGAYAAGGRSISELKASHCDGKLQPLLPNVPRNLSAVIIKCLAVNPIHRFVAWNEIMDVLEQIYIAMSGQPAPQLLAEEMNNDEQVQDGRSYNELGAAYIDIGIYEKALDFFEKAYSNAQEGGDQYGEGSALANIGAVYLKFGDARKAIDYFERSLTINHELNDQHAVGIILNNLGLAYAQLGERRRAIGYHEQALSIQQEIGDRQWESGSLVNLGRIFSSLGEVKRGIDYYEKALDIQVELGNRRLEGAILSNMGDAYLRLGEARQAIEYYDESLTIARDIGNRSGEGGSLSSLGLVYLAIGQAKQAIGYFEQSVVIDREIGDRRGEAGNLTNLGECHRVLDNMQRAIAYYQQALIIFREINNPEGEGNTLGNLGIVYRKLGDMQRAIHHYEQHLALARKIGDRRSEGRASGNLGVAYDDLGDSTRAIEYHEQYLAIAREIGDQQGEGIALGNLGLAYEKLGDVQKCLEYLKQALIIHRSINDRAGSARHLYNMALLYDRQGELDLALTLAQEAAKTWQQIESPSAEKAQQLVARLVSSGAAAKTDPAQVAFETFQRASSPQDMQVAVNRYHFMVDKQFIQAIEKIITEQVPPEHRPTFQQRLSWLKQIAQR